ncbi:MAG: 3-isopropylmalate dehydratase [Burkholderiales bacterium]|nr:3-isopropylmalate dehydratase [Burkholderiales bacterium]
MNIIKGSARLLGDEVSTDIHCSSKYLPGKDTAYIATVAFDQVAPGFAKAFVKGDIIVAGKNFGINSSREQAVHIMHRLGVAGIIAPSFGRQFYRNAINNGMPVVECDTSGITAGDAVELDLAGGRVSVPSRNIARSVPPLPAVVQALLTAGGLIPFLQKHPDWNLKELEA